MIISLINSRIICLSVLLFTILAMVSCDEENNPHVGDVEGVVIFAATSIPVSDVTIEVNGMTTVSAEDGSYRIEQIETGQKTLNAERAGFIPFSTEIDVQEGTITLVIPLFSPVFTATVHGVIKGDFSGNPKQGIEVVMMNPDGSKSGISATSNENGIYQLEGVPFGERRLEVTSSSILLSRQDFTLSATDHELDIIVPEPMEFTDTRDGHIYSARKIGDQVWMQENLAYLPLVFPSNQGSDTLERYYVGGYQGTDPDGAKNTDFFSVYGVLYNWKAAESACPDGWHLPSDNEWKKLEIYLGMDPQNADTIRWRTTGEVGIKLKASWGWESDGNGNNESGFAALPGGSRGDPDGFDLSDTHCNFWTSTLNIMDLPLNRFLSYNNNGVSRYGFKKNLGFSVRCVKD